jgi:hypothetical protein
MYFAPVVPGKPMYDTWMGAGCIAKISFLAPCILEPNGSGQKGFKLYCHKDIKVDNLMRNSCKGLRIQGHPEQGTHGMELN